MSGSPLTRKQRFWYTATGCVLLGLLVVARCLPPSEFGFGTHQKLGLPPCTAVALFGIPCPTCGMTTSWAHFTRGNISMSWQCNPGGLCLAIVSFTVSCWAFFLAGRGQYYALLSLRASTALAVLITLLTVVHWLGRIF